MILHSPGHRFQKLRVVNILRWLEFISIWLFFWFIDSFKLFLTKI